MGGKTRPRRWNGLFKRDPKSNDWLKNKSLKGFTAWNFKTALKTRESVVPAKEADPILHRSSKELCPHYLHRNKASQVDRDGASTNKRSAIVRYT